MGDGESGEEKEVERSVLGTGERLRSGERNKRMERKEKG